MLFCFVLFWFGTKGTRFFCEFLQVLFDMKSLFDPQCLELDRQQRKKIYLQYHRQRVLFFGQDNCHSASFLLSGLQIWSGCASLHHAEEHLRGMRSPYIVHALCMLVFDAVSPRPGLVKLLALSNFQARCRSHVIRVSPDISASFCDHC